MNKREPYLTVGDCWFLSTAYVVGKEYKKVHGVQQIPDNLNNIFYKYDLYEIPYVDFIEHFGINTTKEALAFIENENNYDKLFEYDEWYVDQLEKDNLRRK